MIKKIFIISMLIISCGTIANAMSYSEAFEICRDNCGHPTLFNTNRGSVRDLLSLDDFLNYIDNSTPAQYMYVFKDNTNTSNIGNVFTIQFFEEFTITGNNYVGTNTTSKYVTSKSIYAGNDTLYDTKYTTNNGTLRKSFPTGNNLFFYMVFDGSNIIASSFVPPVTFSYTPNYFQKVFFPGISDEYNASKYDYSITDWKLGTFEEIPEDANKIVVTLFFADGGTAFSDSFLTYTKLFNQNYFFINNDNLYVHSRYIKYNTKYNLLFYLYDINNSLIESYQFNYVFYPTNASIENGTVVNPGSGDYSVQDSTNDTIAALTDSSDIDSILNLTFSGDYATFADDFGFLPFDNPFSTFLLHIVDSLYDALTVRGNVSLTANYRNYFNFSINSDDFSADYQYKQFVSAMLVFIYLYYNFIFFNHLITLVEIGNVEDAIDLLGFDEFYDSNMM